MSNKSSNTLLAILGGVALGAAAGLLFAPAEGKATRKKFKKGYDDGKVKLKSKYNETKEQLLTKYDDTKSSAENSYEDLMSKMSYKSDDIISFLEDKLGSLRTATDRFKKL